MVLASRPSATGDKLLNVKRRLRHRPLPHQSLKWANWPTSGPTAFGLSRLTRQFSPARRQPLQARLTATTRPFGRLRFAPLARRGMTVVSWHTPPTTGRQLLDWRAGPRFPPAATTGPRPGPPASAPPPGRRHRRQGMPVIRPEYQPHDLAGKSTSGSRRPTGPTTTPAWASHSRPPRRPAPRTYGPQDAPARPLPPPTPGHGFTTSSLAPTPAFQVLVPGDGAKLALLIFSETTLLSSFSPHHTAI
jgi:hypothetical protein